MKSICIIKITLIGQEVIENNIKDIPEWADKVKVKLHRVSMTCNGNIDFDFELIFPDALTQMLFNKFERKRLKNCMA